MTVQTEPSRNFVLNCTFQPDTKNTIYMRNVVAIKSKISYKDHVTNEVVREKKGSKQPSENIENS